MHAPACAGQCGAGVEQTDTVVFACTLIRKVAFGKSTGHVNVISTTSESESQAVSGVIPVLRFV